MTDDKTFPWGRVALIGFGWLSIMFPWHMITPLLPMIQGELSITHVQAGWLMSGYNLVYALTQLPAGFVGDRWGPGRPMLLLSLVGSSAAALLALSSTSYTQLLLLRVLSGFFAGLWYAPSTVLLFASCAKRDRGKALGLVLVALPAARLLVFLSFGALAEHGPDWRVFLGIAAVPGLACAALVWRLFREPSTVRARTPARELASDLAGAARNPAVTLVLGFSWLWQLLFFALATFLPAYDASVRGLAASWVSLLFIVNSLAMIFCGPLAGHLHDRYGFRRPMIGYALVMTALSLFLPRLRPGWLLVAVYLVWGLLGANVAAGVMTGALVARLVPERARAVALGTSNLIAFLGATVGPALFGFLIDARGYGPFFLLAAGLYLAAAAVPVFMSSNALLA